MLSVRKIFIGVALIACVGLVKYAKSTHRMGWLPSEQWTCLLLLCGLVLYDIYRLHPNAGHSVRSLLQQYATQKLSLALGTLLQHRLNRISRNVEDQQAGLLKMFLAEQKGTKLFEYLKLENVSTVKDFISKVPLTTYEVYRPFVYRIEEFGDKDVFFRGHTDYIAITSGTTTGESKKFPKSLSLMRNIGKWIILSQKHFLQVPKNNYLRKWLAVKLKPPFWYSKSGIKCGPISGLTSKMSLNIYVAPDETCNLKTDDEVIYMNLLFGLKDRDICNLFFSTSCLALLFFQILERKWEQICHDIQNGDITGDVMLTSEQRTLFLGYLGKKDPKRANQLRDEFSKGFKGIVPRIWPACAGLFCIASGSFLTQAKVVKENLLGDVPLFSPFHAGTETMYGMNLHLQDPDITYVAMTTINFFEFLPIEDSQKENPKTYLAHQVEVGRQYELVVTTREGLYRYRTEDVVEVTSFYGTIPRYKFVRRSGDILVSGTLRVPEVLLSSSVIEAAEKWKKTILDLTTSESLNLDIIEGAIPEQHSFVVFAEVQNNDILTDEEKYQVDEQLVLRHEVYAKFRANGRIQPVKVIQMKQGTFERLREIILRNNSDISGMQYKLPRIIRQREYVEFLLSNEIR